MATTPTRPTPLERVAAEIGATMGKSERTLMDMLTALETRIQTLEAHVADLEAR